MTAFLQIREADGLTSAALIDWGKVTSGTDGPATNLTVYNSGDLPALNAAVVFGVVGDGLLTGWEIITVGGVAYQSPAAAPLGDIGVGQAVPFTVQAKVPAGAALSTLPLTGLIVPEWDE